MIKIVDLQDGDIILFQADSKTIPSESLNALAKVWHDALARAKESGEIPLIFTPSFFEISIVRTAGKSSGKKNNAKRMLRVMVENE